MISRLVTIAIILAFASLVGCSDHGAIAPLDPNPLPENLAFDGDLSTETLRSIIGTLPASAVEEAGFIFVQANTQGILVGIQPEDHGATPLFFAVNVFSQTAKGLNTDKVEGPNSCSAYTLALMNCMNHCQENTHVNDCLTFCMRSIPRDGPCELCLYDPDVDC